MKIVDANVILRYFLQDHVEMYTKAKNILENEFIQIPNEVIAEVVYVLEKVYKIERKTIKETLIGFLKYSNISVPDKVIMNHALS